MFDVSWLKPAFSSTAYYLVLALVLGWVLSIIKAWRSFHFNLMAAVKSHRTAIFVTFLLCSLVFLGVPKYQRVLGDEAEQLLISRSMLLEQRSDMVTQGQWHDGVFSPINRVEAIRPVLFPFLIHVIHWLTGYRPENAFVLNYLALWGLLFSLHLIIRAYVAPLWSFCALILVLSQPIICLSAASGNYDIVNTLFLVLSLLSLRWFLNTRHAASFEVLFFTLLLLANIRLDSVIFLPLIISLLGLTGYLRKELFTLPVTVAAFAGTLLVLVQCAIRYHNTSTLHYFTFNPETMGKGIFSFWYFIFNMGGANGYAGAINYLGAGLLICFIVLLLFKRIGQDNEGQRYFLLLSLVALLVHFAFLASHRWIFHHPMSGRYYFPMLILLSVLPSVGLAFLCKNGVRPILGVALVFALFVSYFPQAVADTLINRLPSAIEYNAIKKFIAKHAKGNTLIICEDPWQYLPYDQGAISFRHANKTKGRILQQHQENAYGHIFVFHKTSYKDHRILIGALNRAYRLKKIGVIPINSTHYIQISQVNK